MAAPKVYKSTDANAPVACATEKSLINILDACLVDGYGDMPPAGWSRPFVSDDGNGAVYKQGAGGNGCYLKISSLAELPAATKQYLNYIGKGYHGAALFEEMSDYEHGINSTPDENTNYSHAMMPICSRVAVSGSETTPAAWMIIADAAFFYFFVWAGVAGNTLPPRRAPGHVFFCGRFESLNIDDSGNDLVGSFSSDVGSFRYYAGYNNLCSSTGLKLAQLSRLSTPAEYAKNNIGANILVRRLASGAVGCYPAALAWGGGPLDAEYDESKPLLISRPYLADGIPVNNLRGWLPGLYTSNYSYPFDNWTVVEDGDRRFIAVTSDLFQYLIDIGETFRV